MEETLGKRIAFHRKRLNLTQDALAEQLGVTAQAVSKWENNQSCPDITMLPKLAQIFSVTTDELLGVAKKEAPETDLPLPEPEPQPTEESNFQKQPWPSGKRIRIAIALWLLLAGCLTILDMVVSFRHYQFHGLGIGDYLIASGLLVFGLTGLFRRFSLLRLVSAAAGCYFLVIFMDPTLADVDWAALLPIAVVLLGLNLLVNALRKTAEEPFMIVPKGHLVGGSANNYCRYDGAHFDCATTFGHGDRLIQLPRLSGGQGQVVFGELHIDLTACEEIAPDCRLSLDCIFGSLEILIPRRYRVESASQSAFGTVVERGSADPGAEATIHLQCKASFGEICIRHV